MSTSLPPAVLRRAITKAIRHGGIGGIEMATDAELTRVAEALEEAGYLVVARADMHALRAAADKVLRFVPAGPEPNVWCNVSGCPLHGVKPHGHDGRYGPGQPTPL